MALPLNSHRINQAANATASSSKRSSVSAPFHVYHESFIDVLGPRPKLELLAEDRDPLFHEAGVYIESDPSLFVTSNRHGPAGSETIKVTKIHLAEDLTPSSFTANIPGVPMANGGVNHDTGVLFCAQGTLTQPSGLIYLDPQAPHATRPVLTNFHGRAFNSVNDVVVHPRDGSVWFTDPIYGFEQGFRPKPELPNQVYRFEPTTGDVRVVADGFGRPNGICFSPDLRTVYITNTDAVHANQGVDWGRAATIYAFDLDPSSPYPTLTSRRVFAFASSGVPDGIKCDTAGNVYSGCGDGVHVWNSAGLLIGKIAVPPAEINAGEDQNTGVANFCFGPAGTMFLLNETRIWKVTLSGSGVKGALLRI